ncbi:DndB-like DNA-sulfur modification-associated protein [Actinomadura pelletieri DSM 43383]|uniref:DndB-like DNA-sulfur modification-associated protein n=1 Tax=Actinomadura pelletieri DSM 43383 TaxID=1120940 RepID=A0A495QX28_9ACTN|nr:DNA sulfur modification protein DndB [Actinomadura pelletieri]RKS78660.1 DndB-like DNA-sulfur modification-associated protein [Actinomadura pelletieri DSM 43383]
MFGSGTRLTFRDYVQGTWGSFDTPAGQVNFVMTKARLGGDADAPERQLTKCLAPVREIMDAGDLDFHQLLQRDLDDHRVAVNLIPYLLKPQSNGPAFFPPIMTVLLPFRNKRPSTFPPLEPSTATNYDDALWQEERAGNAFQVHRLLGPDGTLHAANLGKLWWNRSEASLVVLDGQHRAMALLAVERTLSHSWQGSGAQFRPFYEHQVERMLRDYQVSEADLARIEVPITVCWFPEQTGEGTRPHEAARKLFVDVNKEARPPSESRIILLSDGELSNVLTRSMLSALRSRSNDSYLPLYAVEYDNPEVNSSRSARWSVMTNVHLLKMAVNRCVFGPPKYLTNLAQPISGRESPEDRDRFMRSQLDLVSLLPDFFEDGGYSYDRGSIGDGNFPLGRLEAISERFMETWGKAILTLLSGITPYAAHAASLTKLKEDWHAADTYASLAHDALFGGVGVYWTLRDSYIHYQGNHGTGGRKLPKSDVIRAWDALKGKEADFDIYRSQEYLGSTRPERVKRCKAAYGIFNTHACQLGLMMTLGSLWELRKQQAGGADFKDLPAFAEALVKAWNAFFHLDHGRARDRKLALNKDVTNPINQIVNMDTPQAVYFRYFWMQALAVPEAWRHAETWLVDRDAFEYLLSQARRMYLDLCIKQQEKALKTSQPGLPRNDLSKTAEKFATTALKKALRHWFDVSEEDIETWLQHQPTNPEQISIGETATAPEEGS